LKLEVPCRPSGAGNTAALDMFMTDGPLKNIFEGKMIGKSAT